MSLDGITLIAIERKRQVEHEGYTAAHDDEHGAEMAMAAACYAVHGTGAKVLEQITAPTGAQQHVDAYPWGWPDKRKEHTRLRQLAIAGALIAAEIDRLIRTGRAPEGGLPEAQR